ncbi:MAG: hypothetical protein AMXMBFR64_01600 [Myxococcales bacterium]
MGERIPMADTSGNAGADHDIHLHQEVERVGALIRARLAPDGASAAALLGDLSREVEAARRRWSKRPIEERPPLLQLAGRFSLSSLELDVTATTLAPHLDPELPGLLRQLRGGMWSEHLDAAVLLRLFARTWDETLALRRAIGPQGALVRNRILVVQDLPAGATALQSAVSLHPRIVHFAVGETGLHHLIAPWCAVEEASVPFDSVVLPDELLRRVLDVLEPHASLRERLARWGYDEALPIGRGAVLLFVGAPGTGKSMLSRALATRMGSRLLRVFVSKMMRSQAAAEDVLDELAVEARLRDAVLLFDDCAPLFAEGGPALAALLAFLDRFDGVAILATNRTENLDLALERRVLLRVDFPRPDRLARERIYESLLPPEMPITEGTSLAELAAAYDFTGGMIKNTVMLALNKAVARDPSEPTLDGALLREAADIQLRNRLDDLAVTSESRLGLADLVLPPDVEGQVHDLLNACRNHEFVINAWGFGDRLPTGKGVISIFDGPPGTGKTLCGEILGTELGRPVSRVNIPSVVSKWVGETERNLQEVFRRARAGRSILLFDEADALFGKRVEKIERATDRYANQEINLLLQEIERYEGIVLLTTNLMSALDDAVMRRILFRIHFPEPDADLRARIWRTLVPRQVPLGDDVDFEELGERFELAGGRIKNAVLRAAYRASAECPRLLCQRHLVRAGVDESRAAGKVVRDLD